MKIIQLMPTITYGDAVSNDAVAIHSLLRSNGQPSEIYAENIGKRCPVKSVKRYQYGQLKRNVKEDDIILYHGSTGTRLNDEIPSLPGRKILRYHNITPYRFFRDYSAEAEILTKKGIAQFRRLNQAFQSVIADSSFNRQDLVEMGYRCRMDVCPVLIPFDDYKKKPDPETERQCRDGVTNILFVGRIAPNKKQEDLIASFYAYRKLYNPDSRLILVGTWSGMERYHARLVQYVEELGLTGHVVFSGHISFSQILAYYRSADLFLCMSEHEGFCVPLVEAMLFRLPILAYNCCAVEETLGGGGLLVSKKDPVETAAAMDYLIRNEELRNYYRKMQRSRLKDLSIDRVGDRLLNLLREFQDS